MYEISLGLLYMYSSEKFNALYILHFAKPNDGLGDDLSLVSPGIRFTAN